MDKKITIPMEEYQRFLKTECLMEILKTIVKKQKFFNRENLCEIMGWEFGEDD